MSNELRDLEIKLKSMSAEEIHEYIKINYNFYIIGTKKELINKIIKHEITKPDIKNKYKTMSESYQGAVTNLEDVGKFIDAAITVIKENDITHISKILIEIDEDFGEFVFSRAYNIKIINVNI